MTEGLACLCPISPTFCYELCAAGNSKGRLPSTFSSLLLNLLSKTLRRKRGVDLKAPRWRSGVKGFETVYVLH